LVRLVVSNALFMTMETDNYIIDIREEILCGITEDGMHSIFMLPGDKEFVKSQIIEEVKLTLSDDKYEPMSIDTKYISADEMESITKEQIRPASDSGIGVLVIDDMKHIIEKYPRKIELIGVISDLLRTFDKQSTGWYLAILLGDIQDEDWVQQFWYFFQKGNVRSVFS